MRSVGQGPRMTALAKTGSTLAETDIYQTIVSQKNVGHGSIGAPKPRTDVLVETSSNLSDRRTEHGLLSICHLA
jgi:hypothetical protein